MRFHKASCYTKSEAEELISVKVILKGYSMASFFRVKSELVASGELRLVLRSCLASQCRCYSSTTTASKDQEEVIERQPENYRPGADSYAYDNPWPKLNRGRLDFLFGDGWRRPLARDQGAKMRRQWIWFGQCSYDEHKDWFDFHSKFFIFCTVMVVYFTFWIVYARPD
ncbi:unnamed protein product, partial [Enterobius vermicularis]|uniref:NADH dehydrogenase [ubiquinone] 1 beta subcomplex subunit 11, mitochondrial n=1 Tax=Enterobius vermicularis TaxID=51028 RepID=A0A0N4VMD2_ENTVE